MSYTVRQKINDLMRMSSELIETGRYDSYREILYIVRYQNR